MEYTHGSDVCTVEFVSDTSFSARESALGYLYQCRLALMYALRHLRERDDVEIAIESLDDVTFSADGKPAELLQTKHHFKSKANLTDASPDIWKTIRIWASQLQLIQSGVRLILITTEQAAPSSAASLLREGQDRDSPTALKRLATIVATSSNQTNAAAYAAFNALSPEQQLQLVEAIIVIDDAPDIVDVRARIASELRLMVRANQLGLFVDRLEGWWYSRVIGNLAGRDDGYILGKELHSQINDLRDQFGQDNLPVDFNNVFPADDAIKAMLGRPFVEQLRLIALTEPRIRYAVIDYYRAFEQRSRWLREDLLLVGDLEQYEEKLVEEWGRAFERIKQDHGVEEESAKQVTGRFVYDWAHEANIYIRPQCREPYIHRGSFQLLADKLRVGWHPEFLARLQHLLSPVEGLT
jgi:hypothetical protein